MIPYSITDLCKSVTAFEAFWCGSWQNVERLRIMNGAISMHVTDDRDVIEADIPVANLRVRSRKASSYDCTCFLRPGLDISVLSTPQHKENSSDENLELVWVDAKISSIERKPHEDTCACQFYVCLYVTQGPVGTAKKALNKETLVMQIDQISILQKLEKNPCENTHHRWNFSEDCSSRQKFKLFTGKFSSDITWLLVASVMKQIVFDVRSIKNQIVYQIWDSDCDTFSPNSGNLSNAINFKLEDGISVPILVPFVSVEYLEEGPSSDLHDDEPWSYYELMDLRRSKRRYVQPERYLGCENMPDADVDVTRIGIQKTYRWEYEEMPNALSIQDDHAFKTDIHTDDEKRVRSFGNDLYESFLLCQINKNKSMVVKSVAAEGGEHQSAVANEGEHESQLAIVPLKLPAETDLIIHEQDPLDTEIPEDHSGEVGDVVSKYLYINDSSKVHRKRTYKANFLELEGGWQGKGPHKQSHRRRGFFRSSDKESIYDARTYARRSLSASMYREMMRRCMTNIEDTIKNNEQPAILDQWKEFHAAKSLNQGDIKELSSKDREEEIPEIDMLWKEMELAMASSYFLEDSEGSHAKVPTEIQKASKHGGQACQHDYRLDEQIGILCRLCGVVSTEIRDVSPTFASESANWIPDKESRTGNGTENKPGEDGGVDLFNIPSSSEIPLSEGSDNVWALIPDLKEKLRFHQKRAFEFLWRNLAGSMVPALMEPASKKRGGCVISHSPGAGKTLLIIAFLESYLKLFPGSRPLVLAPKTTLYTWYKEIIKWKIPIPVYQIHGGQTYRGEVLRHKAKLAPGIPHNQDVMHVLDCLEKMQKWLAHPSVLLMGYTSFLTLTREDSNYAHRKYMNRVLRQCPGILILDEGHNPRSTKSRLRKALMKVDTGLRVLLSGTLFQNNFGEYFNTLCLARPKFVTEVLKELDPRFKKAKKGAITRFSLENRARKLFIDKIATKINSNEAEERLHGLIMLRNMTSRFIDVHEGGSSDGLPGLQSYTLLMKSTTIQQEILVKLQNQRPVYKGFPLELELLITLGSIHPWLIRTTACANQYFAVEELEALEEFKFDLKLGSKVRFVMSLVPRALLRKEKVLIFCHNIAPINLFLEIFERFYNWRKGEEVLVLQGDLELFERGRVMDKFEEPGGPSRVMLASITACAEGISLTAASRVILLDSEWNPSKSKQAIARAFRPGQDKVVYVYQLLATGTLEEEKYRRTTWKEWVSNLIFSEEHVEDPSHWQAPKIEDELLREIVEEDRATLFHMIMKNEKASKMV
ncbi:hypothetical protein RJ639_003190 [Escallonia herrerae]|uniref:SNF2 domain-containing protein CLASSY 1-like n=1 Tax=Escallonia herrerae TaxID=1293975 RepID=A0AA88W4G7_9ASTE|nr:hypothetical protein RJ639_003190 [Escallonia herrerae]